MNLDLSATTCLEYQIKWSVTNCSVFEGLVCCIKVQDHGVFSHNLTLPTWYLIRVFQNLLKFQQMFSDGLQHRQVFHSTQFFSWHRTYRREMSPNAKMEPGTHWHLWCVSPGKRRDSHERGDATASTGAPIFPAFPPPPTYNIQSVCWISLTTAVNISCEISAQ